MHFRRFSLRCEFGHTYDKGSLSLRCEFGHNIYDKGSHNKAEQISYNNRGRKDGEDTIIIYSHFSCNLCGVLRGTGCVEPGAPMLLLSVVSTTYDLNTGDLTRQTRQVKMLKNNMVRNNGAQKIEVPLPFSPLVCTRRGHIIQVPTSKAVRTYPVPVRTYTTLVRIFVQSEGTQHTLLGWVRTIDPGLLQTLHGPRAASGPELSKPLTHYLVYYQLPSHHTSPTSDELHYVRVFIAYTLVLLYLCIGSHVIYNNDENQPLCSDVVIGGHSDCAIKAYEAYLLRYSCSYIFYLIICPFFRMARTYSSSSSSSQ